jgi:hypothetical protein
VHSFNRKTASVSEKSLKQIHAELNIRLMHLRRYLRAVDLEPDLPRPFIDVNEGGGGEWRRNNYKNGVVDLLMVQSTTSLICVSALA